MAARALDDLIALLAKLPGLGPRSARRAALHLIKQRETLLRRLAVALTDAADQVRECSTCGNLDAAHPCWICADGERDDRQICVVENVDDLWALERAGIFRGRYHVLGGALSAIDGYGPQELGIDRQEVIRLCIEESVPIYQGKIDKTLFAAQLAAVQSGDLDG